MLRRERTAPWTVADVALLDEAAELLGDDDGGQGSEAERRAEAERRDEVRYADLVQDTFGGQAFVSAEELARRYTGTASLGSVAERAAADRAWAFGHVVVDEAQELSAMAWRVLMRRVPSRSLTLVGDVAQTGSSAGATSWARVLRPHVERPLAAGRAHRQLPHAGPDHGSRRRRGACRRAGRAGADLGPDRSLRAAATPQVAGDAATSRELVDVVRLEQSLAGEGTVAVITSAAAHTRASAIVHGGAAAEHAGVAC